MKRDKSVKKLFLISFVAVVLIFAFIFRGLLKYETRNLIGNRVKANGRCENCKQFFKDEVSTQEKAYKSEGIRPQKVIEDLEKLKDKGVLIELTSNDSYRLRDMDHSVPYVLPKVKAFLNLLSDAYKLELNNRLVYVPFVITSATRSKRTVRQLMGNNINAIANSAHLKGKTIDISYKEFGDYNEQSKCFVVALEKLHQQKKCYVKYERAQGCLHITVR